MEFNAGMARSGKTSKAIKWVKEGRTNNIVDSSNRILVVRSEDFKRQVMNEYNLGYHEVENTSTILGYYKPVLRTKELWIDDLENFLFNVLSGRVNIVGANILEDGKNG